MPSQFACDGHTMGREEGNSNLVAAVALEKRDGCDRNGRVDAEGWFGAGKRV